jgi:hypothetical protein
VNGLDIGYAGKNWAGYGMVSALAGHVLCRAWSGTGGHDLNWAWVGPGIGLVVHGLCWHTLGRLWASLGMYKLWARLDKA